jgi:hypothetical protein
MALFNSKALADRVLAPVLKAHKEQQEAIKKKREEIRKFRKEASRLAAMANKRVARLEKNNLESSPAYKQYIEGGGKFMVKGKDHNELQKEVARMRRFVEAKTSTVKGTVDTLKEMASNTGIRYESMAQLKVKAGKFFELASKVEQYLRTVSDIASAIGYQKIWEAVNQYTQTAGIELDNTDLDIDKMVEAVTKALEAYESPMPTIDGWYSLKKDPKLNS